MIITVLDFCLGEVMIIRLSKEPDDLEGYLKDKYGINLKKNCQWMISKPGDFKISYHEDA